MNPIAFLRKPEIRRAPARLAARALGLGLEERLFKASMTRERVRRIPGGPLMHLSLDDHIERRLYIDGAFEFPLMKLMQASLSTGMTFVDVGANCGFHALLGAQHVGQAGRVLAFEPNPRVAARLRANVELNRLANVRVFETAITDRDGEVDLYLSNTGTPGDSGWATIRADPGDTSRDRVTVTATTLDTIFAETGGPLDVLKVDVEGAEAGVVRGASGVIDEWKPAIALEVHAVGVRADRTLPEELGLLLEAGYELFQVEPRTRTGFRLVRWLPSEAAPAAGSPPMNFWASHRRLARHR